MLCVGVWWWLVGGVGWVRSGGFFAIAARHGRRENTMSERRPLTHHTRAQRTHTMSKPSKSASSRVVGRGAVSGASSSAVGADRMLVSGLTAFHKHHQAAYKSRWLNSLYPALLLQHPSVAVLNRHLGPRQLAEVRRSLEERGARPWIRGNPDEVECWRFEEETSNVDQTARQIESLSIAGDLDDAPPLASRFLPPAPIDINVSPLLPYYLLDGASVLAVDALTVGAHHSVLDVCAAPGGKSIVAAMALDLMDTQLPTHIQADAAKETLACTQPLATLHSNEPQASRRIRLQTVLSEYLPPAIRKNRTRVEVTGLDATKVSLPAARYDRVLVDAPCSSDRHVLGNSKELASWSTKRIRENADRQELILYNALKSVKVGGIVVYATCSLSRMENDQVIANVIAKLEKSQSNSSNRANRVIIQPLKIRLTPTINEQTDTTNEQPDASDAATSLPADSDVFYLPVGEATKYGWMVLPDQVSTANVSAAHSSSPSAPHTDIGTGSESTEAAPKKAIAHGFGPLYFARLKRVAATDDDDDDDDDSDSSDEDDSSSSDADDSSLRGPSNPNDEEDEE